MSLFRGRLGRKNFVLGFLLYILIFVLVGLSLRIAPNAEEAGIWLYFIGFIGLPFLYSLFIRRFHDFGLSGWYSLLAGPPLIGQITLICLFVIPGSADKNTYGEPDNASFWTSLLGHDKSLAAPAPVAAATVEPGPKMSGLVKVGIMWLLFISWYVLSFLIHLNLCEGALGSGISCDVWLIGDQLAEYLAYFELFHIILPLVVVVLLFVTFNTLLRIFIGKYMALIGAIVVTGVVSTVLWKLFIFLV